MEGVTLAPHLHLDVAGVEVLAGVAATADQGHLQSERGALNVQKKGQEAPGETGHHHHRPKEGNAAYHLKTEVWQRKVHHHQETIPGGQRQQVEAPLKMMFVKSVAALTIGALLLKMGTAGAQARWLETMGPPLKMMM